MEGFQSFRSHRLSCNFKRAVAHGVGIKVQGLFLFLIQKLRLLSLAMALPMAGICSMVMVSCLPLGQLRSIAHRNAENYIN